jgi:hypothetical protein
MKFRALCILASIGVMGCFAPPERDVQFYASNSGPASVETSDIHMENGGCYKEDREVVLGMVDLNLKRISMRNCIPFLVAQAVKETLLGACENKEITLKQQQTVANEETETLILNENCFCYREVKSERISYSHVKRYFADLQMCATFFSPDQYTQIEEIARDVYEEWHDK